MAFVKEKLARRANAEDDVSGAFFEKRFEMRRLLSPNAVLACSLYVDLNPIRAGIAMTPETSRHTSAYRRIRGMLARKAGKTSKQAMQDGWLAPIHDREVPLNQQFADRSWRASDDPALAMTLQQYLQLLDYSGRQAKSDKPGKIPSNLLPILERLRIGSRLGHLTREFGALFRRVAGDPSAVERHARSHGRRWFQGITNCRQFFGGGE